MYVIARGRCFSRPYDSCFEAWFLRLDSTIANSPEL